MPSVEDGEVRCGLVTHLDDVPLLYVYETVSLPLGSEVVVELLRPYSSQIVVFVVETVSEMAFVSVTYSGNCALG